MAEQLFTAQQLFDNIVKPVLVDLDKFAINRSQLIVGTGIQESDLIHVKQIGGGPGRGLWQCERITYNDYYNSYLVRKKPLLDKILNIGGYRQWPDHEVVTTNHKFACALVFVHYYRIRQPLPGTDDIYGQAEYYKRYYNTYAGAATVDQYIEKWNKYASSVIWE